MIVKYFFFIQATDKEKLSKELNKLNALMVESLTNIKYL